MFIVAYAVWVERRSPPPSRTGTAPIASGIFGLFQPAADAVKSFLKEDFTPGHVRKVYFWLAPAIVMIPSLLTVAIIPFGSQLGQQRMVIANLNVGILYTFGISSLGVYGIVLAGYAANSKYPFLGGIRSSAQMISYEIAMGMSVVPLFLIAGGLDGSSAVAGFSKAPAASISTGWSTRPTRLALLRRSSCSWPPCSPRPTGCPSTCRRRSRNWPAATTSSTVRLSSPCFSWANTPP